MFNNKILILNQYYFFVIYVIKYLVLEGQKSTKNDLIFKKNMFKILNIDFLKVKSQKIVTKS